jgi:hypothetical protein
MAAGQHHARLPQFHAELWSDRKLITEYQNALLEVLGVAGTMRSLTDTLAACIEVSFEDLATDIPEFPKDEHQETFRRLLRFRVDNLDGGALFDDALTSKATMQSFALSFVPAIVVGAVSRSGRPPSHGLDVDLQVANFAQMRDVICEFVTGDNECAAVGPPRACAAPAHDLCARLAADDGVVRCLRAQSIRRLKAALGASSVTWSTAEAPLYRYV